MLKDELQELVNIICHQRRYNELEKLEDIASKIIINDDFDSLPDYVQSEVYFIDMQDIEESSPEEIMDSARVIERFITSQ